MRLNIGLFVPVRVQLDVILLRADGAIMFFALERGSGEIALHGSPFCPSGHHKNISEFTGGSVILEDALDAASRRIGSDV